MECLCSTLKGLERLCSQLGGWFDGFETGAAAASVYKEESKATARLSDPMVVVKAASEGSCFQWDLRSTFKFEIQNSDPWSSSHESVIIQDGFPMMHRSGLISISKTWVWRTVHGKLLVGVLLVICSTAVTLEGGYKTE